MTSCKMISVLFTTHRVSLSRQRGWQKYRSKLLDDIYIFTLQALRQVISSGWPQNTSDLPPPVGCYLHYHNELSCHDAIILKNDRIIITSQSHHISDKEMQ